MRHWLLGRPQSPLPLALHMLSYAFPPFRRCRRSTIQSWRRSLARFASTKAPTAPMNSPIYPPMGWGLCPCGNTYIIA